MVKLRFIGEGPSDVGLGAEINDSEPRYGCVYWFVRNILEKWKGNHVHIRRSRDIFPRLNLRLRPRRGYEAKVRAALVQAREEQMDGVVIVVDQPPSREVSRLARMQEGRKVAREQGIMTPCALGVAIPEIEAWLLANEKARAKNLPPVGRRPLPVASPETLPDAKLHFLTLYGEYRRERELKNQPPKKKSEVGESLAIDARVDHLERLCPRGFAPFAEDVQNEIGENLFRRKSRR